VITVSDWAEIRRLSLNVGLSGRAIAARLGISTNTVAKALACDQPPCYRRAPVGSKVDRFVPAISALLVKDPRLKATVIAERVGYNGGVSTSIFRARVRQLKLALGMIDPADRLVFSAGEQIQCDLWFPQSWAIQTGLKYPVVTMTACWSRYLQAVMVPSRMCGDILGGMNVLLSRFGGLPRRLLWDNESGIVHRRQLIPQATAWAGAMGADIKLTKPKDPETKGRIERANGYLGSSFEPARSFSTIDDFNDQLTGWLEGKANQRLVRATGARPSDLINDERQQMRPLPDPLPSALITSTTRLARESPRCVRRVPC